MTCPSLVSRLCSVHPNYNMFSPFPNQKAGDYPFHPGKNLPNPQEAETQQEGPVGRVEDKAAGTTHMTRTLEPIATPHHAKSARTFIYWIILSYFVVIGVPVLHPLQDVPTHVFQTQGVALEFSHRGGCDAMGPIVIGMAG